MMLYDYRSTMQKNSVSKKPMPRPRDPDFEKHVRYFVAGAMTEYYLRTGRGSEISTNTYEFNLLDVTNTVIRYLAGTKTLDGSCSDFECSIAHEAAKIWGWPN
jgi:hypothetical protein